jgi:anti-anti-sigma factor
MISSGVDPAMDRTAKLTIAHTVAGTVQILHLTGVLNQSTGPELERWVLAMPGGTAVRLVLELSGVRYVSSSGISAFIVLHRRLRAGGGILVLASPSEALAEMLLTLNLGTLIPIHETVGAGVRAAS